MLQPAEETIAKMVAIFLFSHYQWDVHFSLTLDFTLLDTILSKTFRLIQYFCSDSFLLGKSSKHDFMIPNGKLIKILDCHILWVIISKIYFFNWNLFKIILYSVLKMSFFIQLIPSFSFAKLPFGIVWY